MKFKDKKCEMCEDMFEPTSGRQRFCSAECRRIAANKNQTGRYKKYYNKNRKKEVERVKEHNKETGYQKEYSKTTSFKASKKRYYEKNKEYFHNKTRERRERIKNEKLRRSEEGSEQT